jgi:hypothetical protein
MLQITVSSFSFTLVYRGERKDEQLAAAAVAEVLDTLAELLVCVGVADREEIKLLVTEFEEEGSERRGGERGRATVAAADTKMSEEDARDDLKVAGRAECSYHKIKAQ